MQGAEGEGAAYDEYFERMEKVQEEHDCVASLLIVEGRSPTGEEMRHILVTNSREKALDKMDDFCTAGQAGDEMMFFNTSTGNEICGGIPKQVQAALKKKTLPQRFDALFALTHGLWVNDLWISDNECYEPGEALETAIKALAKAWRNLLGSSDGALGIDGDFTRPGIEALLTELQKKFEESDAACDFDFDWRA